MPAPVPRVSSGRATTGLIDVLIINNTTTTNQNALVKDNNDKDDNSSIKMTRQSNDAASLNFNKEGGHASLQ